MASAALSRQAIITAKGAHHLPDDTARMANYGADLYYEFDQITPPLHLAETEDSWKRIDGALAKLDGLTKAGAYKHDAFIVLLKEHAAPIVSALLSERTKLSGTAADLLNSVAPRLAHRFEALLSTFVPALLQLCARTNKVALIRARKSMLLIAKHCKLPALLPFLREASHNKSVTLRNVSVEVLVTLLESIEDPDRLDRRVPDIENIIRSTATDRDPEVRRWSKQIFELYLDRWPQRVDDFTAAFTPTTKRYLSFAGPSTSKAVQAPHHQQRQTPHVSTTPKATPSRFALEARRPLQPTQPVAHTVQQRNKRDLSARSDDSKETSPNKRDPYTSTAIRRDQVNAQSETDKRRPVSRPHTKLAHHAIGHKAPSSAPCSKQEEAQPQPSVSSQSSTQTDSQRQEEQRQRAALQADIARTSSTTTPSRGIAARLALEQFEARIRKGKATQGTQPESGPRAAMTAFAIAASKKNSPRRLPTRVPLAQAPTSTLPAQTLSKVAMAQRIAVKPSSDSNPATPARTTNGTKGRLDEHADVRSPDVFESRPMPRIALQQQRRMHTSMSSSSAGKTMSTVSKSLSAKETTLGRRAKANVDLMQRRSKTAVKTVASAATQQRASAQPHKRDALATIPPAHGRPIGAAASRSTADPGSALRLDALHVVQMMSDLAVTGETIC